MDVSPPFLPDPDRLEALAEFAAGAGHEINNPLATIIGRAQQLLRDETDPQRRQSLATIAAQAYRIRDMIGDVMTFARPPEPQRQRMDLSACVAEVVTRFQATAAQRVVEILNSRAPAVPISGDTTQISLVVEELLRNALAALPENGGAIQVNVQATASGQASLSITDNGRGFTELELQHAFDPFYSGRQAGRGLGFGLCKVWQIVQLHAGHIAITSDAGATAVSVTLPLIE